MAITVASDVAYDQTAWDLATRFSLRPQLYFDSFATVKPTNADKPGSSVNFTFTADLAAATTALTENVDVTPVTFSDSQINVTVAEYGNAIKTSALLRGTSFLPVNPVVTNLVGYNAGISFDTLARNALVAGDNVIWGGDASSTATIDAADVISATDIRLIVARMRTASVMDWGGWYVGFVHPDVAVDLRTETGGVPWQTPHAYDTSEMYTGQIGAFEGVIWVETPRVALLTDGGATTTDVYQNLIFGQEALAKTFSQTVSGPEPMVRPGPVTDTLRRFVPVGWYWLGGFKILRQEAVRRLEVASSIGANT